MTDVNIYDGMSDYDKNMQLQTSANMYKKDLQRTVKGRSLLRSLNDQLPFFDPRELESKRSESFIKPIEHPTVQHAASNRIKEVQSSNTAFYNYKHIYAPRNSRGDIINDKPDQSKDNKTILDLLKNITGQSQPNSKLSDDKSRPDNATFHEP